MELKSIGKIKVQEDEMFIKVNEEFKDGLKGLEGFSHLDVLWWFDKFDDAQFRSNIIEKKPYKKGPEEIGVFATRSPIRPNPIALSVVSILYIDYEEGKIYIPYIDAFDNSEVLDLKPYTPSVDRVRNCKVPQWCINWPSFMEDSGDFDWKNEFNF